jgi:hypothetical protein
MGLAKYSPAQGSGPVTPRPWTPPFVINHPSGPCAYTSLPLHTNQRPECAYRQQRRKANARQTRNAANIAQTQMPSLKIAARPWAPSLARVQMQVNKKITAKCEDHVKKYCRSKGGWGNSVREGGCYIVRLSVTAVVGATVCEDEKQSYATLLRMRVCYQSASAIPAFSLHALQPRAL